MKKLIWFCLFFLLALPFTVFAQEQETPLKVVFSRDWGYGGFAGDIQGKFSFKVTAPDSLVEVRYMIDDQVMAVMTTPPFKYQFNTDSYPPGPHTLSVIGILADGTEIAGPEFRRVFLSAEEANKATTSLMMPLLIGIGGLTLLGTVVTLLMSRKNRFALGKYGMAGGAVCSRCQLPFSRNMLAPNMLFGKLERCPHCGKWAIVRAATPQELAEAEQRYTADETKLTDDAQIKDENWKKSLDDTRYE